MRRAFVAAMGALTCATGLVACYGSTATHVSPSPTASPKVTPTPTASPSPTPTSSPTPSGTPSPKPSGSPSSTPSPSPTPSPTPTQAAPQVIHIGFELGEFTDPTYGPVWYYGMTPGNVAQVVVVKSGSQVVFLNDGTPQSPHTAGGFGSSGFPAFNDNQNQFTQNGSVIDSSLTWSTGSLNPGQMSQVFTVGPPGVYYFGCGYHYISPPTQTNQSMGDVLVSQ